MINHTMLGTNDLAAATKFYDEALGALGYKRTGSLDGHSIYGEGRPQFVICRPFDGNKASVGNGTHVAFLAPSRAAVDAFYERAMALGGTDEGPPGPRPQYSANYYGAYVRDLDGNKIQAVCHDPD